VDIDVFQEAKKVIDALQNKEVAPALVWCADNKSRLKKSKVYAYWLSLILVDK
jgi:macrophage erythroblast attacher